ncbi:MAG: hypothetical protein A2X84_06015 [Desulfuromonadaceae bacterium GWC2_58_13]|nr:MAG: hypothetical protein A2X84_06015 [Desulfuromonadaceae bacterium GWC2_58_13]
MIRIVLWAHQLLAEVLSPGDTAVDLTAGNGADTLFLARQVGTAGRVLAFDIQHQALRNTADRLAAEGIAGNYFTSPEDLPGVPGVCLIHDSHDRLDRYLDGPVKAFVANLGYLPGGDPSLITRAGSTLAAIRQALELLVPGGRLAVVAYVGHPSGGDESRQVDALLQGLSSRHWHIVRLQVVNRDDAPYLLVVEKR